MSRERDPQQRAAATIDRIAHAFDPARWKGRSLVVAIVVFVLIGVLIVVQRALLADDLTGWIITGIHAVIVVVAVPLLCRRAVRDWRAVNRPQPSGVPE